FRQSYSALELPRLAEGNARFELVYVDGSHLFEDVFVDTYFVIRLLAEGGVVVFDDSSNPHVSKVLRFLRTTISPSRLAEIDLSVYRESQNSLRYLVSHYLRKTQMTAFRRIGNVERTWDAPFRWF